MNLLAFFSTPKRLLRQQQEIDQLRKELDKLRTQNDSMREGMRRCVTCEYRIDFKQRQEERTGVQHSPPAPQKHNNT